MSELAAELKSVTGCEVKNQVNMEPIWFVVEQNILLAGDGGNPFGHGCGGALELGIEGLLVGDEVFERSDSGGHGERISAEGSGLIDRAEGSQMIHDVGAPAEGSAGQAPADDLAERGEVGLDVVEALSATQRDAESGHDLVEDEKGTVFTGNLAQAFEKAWRGRDGSGVSDDGLEDDTAAIWSA